MSTPRRIQRKRTKGWRIPEGSVYVGRPTKWGNPFHYRTPSALARTPALDGSPWEYESRCSADGYQHNYHHPDGRITAHHVRYMTLVEIVDLYRRTLLHPTWELSLTIHVPRPDLGRNRRDVVILTPAMVQAELAGRDLVCWCPLDQPCHADVLLAVANGGQP